MFKIVVVVPNVLDAPREELRKDSSVFLHKGLSVSVLVSPS